ncbi:MAG: OmpH family outer membrane protein [Muribaculaceae bacterium]|nr:OmpH family outer membrane protein [Muribaculaceae bacterium]
MLKKFLIAALVALPMVASAQSFGVVRTQEILEAMPAFQEMKTKIEASSKTYEDEFNKLQQEFEKKYTEFQTLQSDSTTPDTIKERRMQELQELDNKIQQFRNTAQQDLQRQQMTLLQPIQEKVMQAIQTVGQEGNYTFVFENTAPLYTGKSVVDVTDAVRKALGI